MAKQQTRTRKDFETNFAHTTQVHSKKCPECKEPVSKPHDKRCSFWKSHNS